MNIIKSHKILVADDEEDLCEILQFNLESEGYRVVAVHSSEEALKKDLSKFDLFILDVMMGKISGFALAQKIRKEFKLQTPIIFLTARNSENDLLTGFNIGADDFISKPFSVRELQARVKTILKRTGNPADDKDQSILEIGGIQIDLKAKRVIIGEEKVDLTRREFEILLYLTNYPGRVLSRSDILNRVWEKDIIVTDRTVDVNMARLRKKLGRFGQYIKNKPGYGYIFDL